jgi:DNA-binding response OmpR family regulator
MTGEGEGGAKSDEDLRAASWLTKPFPLRVLLRQVHEALRGGHSSPS